VIELHASRSGDSGTFVTFIYEKDPERLLRHVTGTDEDEVILRIRLVKHRVDCRDGVFLADAVG
jgi:hypothetical protein